MLLNTVYMERWNKNVQKIKYYIFYKLVIIGQTNRDCKR